MADSLAFNNETLLYNNQYELCYIPPIPIEDEVTLGTQTWTNKNLAIDDGLGGIYTRTVNYGQGDVVEYYYTWDAANRVANSIQGWHIPTNEDWNTLATFAGGSANAGTKLKSTYGWNQYNGEDTYGFSVFPAGLRGSNGTYENKGYIGYIWSNTKYTVEGNVYNCEFYTRALHLDILRETAGCSVRLVKD